MQAGTENIARSVDNRIQVLFQSTEQSAISNDLNMARALQCLQELQVECQTSAQMVAEQNAGLTLLQREMKRFNETVRSMIPLLWSVVAEKVLICIATQIPVTTSQ